MKNILKETAKHGKQIAINCNKITKTLESELIKRLNIIQSEISISTNFYNPTWNENILYPIELYKFMIYVKIKNKATFLIKMKDGKITITANHLINTNYPKKGIENIQNIILEILNN